MAPPRKRSTNSYHHGNLREAMVNEALGLVSQRGQIDFTMREIARRTGVSSGAPFRHFRDRASLLTAIATEGHEVLNQAMIEAATQSGDPVAKLKNMMLAFVRFVVAQPAHYQVISSLALHPTEPSSALEAARAESLSIVLRALEDAHATGGLRHRVTRRLAVQVWSIVHGLAALVLSEAIRPNQRAPSARWENLAKDTIDLLFVGL